MRLFLGDVFLKPLTELDSNMPTTLSTDRDPARTLEFGMAWLGP